MIDGDVENGSLMAGQSVGLVRRRSSRLAEILAELVEQTATALARDGARAELAVEDAA